MISKQELKKLCIDRLEDAKTLYNAGRYDGAFYLCGYVVEIGLKLKICEMLNWIGYPSSNGEFKNFSSFKTHDIEVLLHLSGVEAEIKTKLIAEWSIVTQWNPEIRYSTQSQQDQNAKIMLEAAEKLLQQL